MEERDGQFKNMKTAETIQGAVNRTVISYSRNCFIDLLRSFVQGEATLPMSNIRKLGPSTLHGQESMVSDLWSKNFPTERGKIRSQMEDKNEEQAMLSECLPAEWETDVEQETEIEDVNSTSGQALSPRSWSLFKTSLLTPIVIREMRVRGSS